MKRLLAITVFLILSFFLYACSDSSSNISLNQHVNLEKLKCSLPAEWSKIYGSVETVTYAPPGDKQATFALLFYSPEGMALMGKLDEAEDWIKHQNDSIEIRSTEDTNIEGHQAKRIVYSYPNNDGTQSTCKSILIDADGALAALSLTTETEAFPDNEELFDAVLNSVSFSEAE